MRSNIKNPLVKSSHIFLNQSDAPRPVQLQCRYHPGSICLNYCHEFQCFRLLCQECIEEHLEHHKKTSLPIVSIKSLKKVRQFCIDKLNKLLEELCLNMNHLKQPKNPQQIIEDVNFKFQKVKAIMFEIIESELNRFQQQIRNKVNESFSTIKNLEDIHSNLEKIIKQLADSKSIIIDGAREMPDAMEKVLAMDDQVYKESFSRQVQIYSQKLSMTEFDISINQGAFRNSVNQCLKLTKNQFKPQFEDMGVSRSRNMIKQKNPFIENNLQELKSIERSIIPRIESRIPLLHFFETNEPYLHLIDLSSSQKSAHPKHSVVKLGQPYYVPEFHASILSETGYIFLSGGILLDEAGDENHQSIKSNLMSKYSIKEQKFKEDFATVTPRSSHSLVESEGYIFILGGYGPGAKIQYKFEQVNIRSGESTVLPKSNYGGANISSLFYPYIIKASEEGIEMYSLPSNNWSIVKIQNYSYNFYRECGYSKLSEDTFLVYGGYNTKDEEGVDECYAWEIHNQSNLSPSFTNQPTLSIEIQDLREIKLPDKGGFWNNPGIIVNGSLYVLQNIEDPETGDVIENERDLLQFDGERWMKVKY